MVRNEDGTLEIETRYRSRSRWLIRPGQCGKFMVANPPNPPSSCPIRVILIPTYSERAAPRHHPGIPASVINVRKRSVWHGLLPRGKH